MGIFQFRRQEIEVPVGKHGLSAQDFDALDQLLSHYKDPVLVFDNGVRFFITQGRKGKPLYNFSITTPNRETRAFSCGGAGPVTVSSDFAAHLLGGKLYKEFGVINVGMGFDSFVHVSRHALSHCIALASCFTVPPKRDSGRFFKSAERILNLTR